MVSRLGFDALSAVVLALTALLGAYTPAYLAKRDRLTGGSGRSMTYVLGNMLSAGVMVSAGFCHLLGEALKQMPKMQFPLAPFLCGTGYMLTLVADKIAASSSGLHHGCGHSLPTRNPAMDSCCAVEVLAGVDIAERGHQRDKHSSSEPEVEGLLHSHEQQHQPLRSSSPVQPRSNGGLARQHSGGAHGLLGGGSRGGSGVVPEHAAVAGGGLEGNGCLYEGKDIGGGSGLQQQHSAPRHRAVHRDSSDSLVFELEPPLSGGDGGGLSHHHHHSAPGSGGGANGLLLAPAGSGGLGGGGGSGNRSVTFLTAVLMGVALCFHSLLEGAAMGAQPTISNSLHIFIAIVSHKGLAAYALGSSIVDSDVSMRRFWSVILPFTFASPVGIFLGYIVSDIAKGVGAASISALASGTFLYVAFMEVIPKEMRDHSHMAAKLGALLVGFALMSVLAVWA